MKSSNGKLIVIDGLDGCGKSTQFELITNELKKLNKNICPISFPDYEKPSSTLVKMYLNGDFSNNADEINAYAASSFYAVDRYASFKLYWEDKYNLGDIILASRYTTSNAIHQMSKLDESLWNDYLIWLEDYEYNKLMLPKPDLVIFLDMPIEVSQKLLSKRYDGDENKKDIHESNLKYLSACRKTALYSARKLGWSVIDCSDGENAFSIEKIKNEILKEINQIL